MASQVFEGFWEAWGDFSVSYALSHDGGRTWINRQKLYDPPGAAMAGAPQVAVDSSGRVYASCMTNDMDGPDFPNWDERTGVRVSGPLFGPAGFFARCLAGTAGCWLLFVMVTPLSPPFFSSVLHRSLSQWSPPSSTLAAPTSVRHLSEGVSPDV